MNRYNIHMASNFTSLSYLHLYWDVIGLSHITGDNNLYTGRKQRKLMEK